ncbi:MAG TPA: hypothetical protein VNT32_13035 [Thermoleophilaceae bacterium]|nr:hypothetical protein [Thermoleophilaceae bacterium]
MVLSRPVLIALLGGVLAIAALTLSRASGGDDETTALPGETGAVAVPAGGEVRSAKLAVKLTATDLVGGGQGESGSMELTGAFQAGDAGDAPKFDFRLAYESPADSGSFGIVSTGDRAFVTENGTAYELPSEAFAQITALWGQGAAAPQADLSQLGALRNREAAPGPRIDGVATEKVTGDVDVPGFLTAISSLSQVAGQGSARLDAAAQKQLAGAVDRARVESYRGEDGVLRRFNLDLRLAVPAALRAQAGGFESGRIKVSVELTGVNEPQAIGVPKRVSKGEPSSDVAALALPLLAAGSLAIDPPEAATRAPAAGEQPAEPEAAPVTGDGVPAEVAEALDREKIVVLLFTQDGGDDAATGASVREIRRLRDRGVAVFQDSVTDLAEYRRVVADLGISRAPAIVVVGADRQATVLEGYIDSATLAQTIRDTR